MAYLQWSCYHWFPAPPRDEALTDEQRLLNVLRVNYDPAVRPVFDARQTVVIHLGITLTQIIDVVSVCACAGVLRLNKQKCYERFTFCKPTLKGLLPGLPFHCETVFL